MGCRPLNNLIPCTTSDSLYLIVVRYDAHLHATLDCFDDGPGDLIISNCKDTNVQRLFSTAKRAQEMSVALLRREKHWTDKNTASSLVIVMIVVMFQKMAAALVIGTINNRF